MKKILLPIFLSCITLVLYAQHDGNSQESKVPSNPSVISSPDTSLAQQTLLLKEEVYDFGKIPQGKPVNHIFEVSNTGKNDLKIANVQASCGCTTPEWDKENAIPAGKNSKITVGYNAAAEGPFTKLVTVTYNENLTKTITIKGEVWKTPASSAPANAGLNDLKD